MLKRKNDRQPQSMEELYPDDYWLDEEDGEEELPVPEMKRKPVSGRLHDEPMVTGYEALERQRGVRRPNRKLTRREKKALKRAQKYEEKLHKEHEKADKKNAKREAKLAARAEKQAVRDAKKNAKKKKSRPAAAPPGQRPAGKAVSGTRSSGTGKKTPDSARDKRITAQQSIPYHEMGRDGICRVQDKFYSKTIRFYDINYQLAQNEDKNALPTEKKRFIPNSNRATWLALIIPGGGQIYNRKYWKLPIVYGGFMGCAYALSWNGKMYKDYSQAYLDIMDDDPNTKSYEDFLPPNADISGQEERYKEIFRKRKDLYRRQRDLSIFAFIGVYLLSVIDAYVDAELSDFDISKDLGLKIEPVIFNDGRNKIGGNAIGLQCSLKF